VTDNDENPIPSVHVLVVNKGGKTIAMQLTNTNGTVSFSEKEVPTNQTFDLKLSFIGFETSYRSIVGGNTYSFKLEESNVMLNQVVVTAQYSANSPEKAVHNINQ